MANNYLTDLGLGHGRNWSALPADEGPLEWTIDPDGNLVQGPLDLEFLRGKRLSLVLEPGQYALLVRGRELLAVYLDGAHTLDIGTGERQVPTDCHLVFLAGDRTLDVSWNRGQPLATGIDRALSLIGGCSLVVERPARFYRTFLESPEATDPEFVSRLIDQFVSGLVEQVLTDADANGNQAAVQGRLTSLGPDDLNDELAPCGLRCVNLALYTSTPPVEIGQADPATVG